MAPAATIAIRMFGALYTLRRQRGLDPVAEVVVPDTGRSAREIAVELDLPLEKIEGIFINHVVYDLDHLVHPGDRVAFVPTGVPGPHRYTLGIRDAGRQGKS